MGEPEEPQVTFGRSDCRKRASEGLGATFAVHELSLPAALPTPPSRHPAQPTERKTGTVKWFNSTKGEYVRGGLQEAVYTAWEMAGPAACVSDAQPRFRLQGTASSLARS